MVFLWFSYGFPMVRQISWRLGGWYHWAPDLWKPRRKKPQKKPTGPWDKWWFSWWFNGGIMVIFHDFSWWWMMGFHGDLMVGFHGDEWWWMVMNGDEWWWMVMNGDEWWWMVIDDGIMMVIPSGKHRKSSWKWPLISWIYLIKNDDCP